MGIRIPNREEVNLISRCLCVWLRGPVYQHFENSLFFIKFEEQTITCLMVDFVSYVG